MRALSQPMNTNAPAFYLVVVGGVHDGRVIPVVPPFLIGRASECHLRPASTAVSSLHCVIEDREGHIFIQDLGSTNGIKVNSERVNARALRPGDEVSIAKQRYTIQYDLPASAAQALEDIFSSEDIMGQSLLEKAGLAKRRAPQDEDTDE